MNQRLSVTTKMIHLRFLVGALGERIGWWPSRFSDEIGLRRLAALFPRTALRAALESMTVAARRDHDGKLSPASVHLFRLGSTQEDAIAQHLAKGVELPTHPLTVDEILTALDELGPPDGSTAPVGPCSVGNHHRTRRQSAVADMARIYAGAARADHRAIPYFEVAG